VPGNRLSLAVGVGGEDQFVVGLERLGDGADMLLAVARHLPFHLKIMVGVDRPVLRRQVSHMAVGCENRIAGAQIFVDCLGLGGGLDDDNCHENLCMNSR
jgi:hypothetical protein